MTRTAVETTVRRKAFRLDPPDPVFDKGANPEAPSIRFRLSSRHVGSAAPATTKDAEFPPCQSLDDVCLLTGIVAFILDTDGVVLRCSANIGDRLGYSVEACREIRFSALGWRGEGECGAESLRCELFVKKLREVGRVSEFDLALADRFGLRRPFRCQGVAYLEDPSDQDSGRLLVTAHDMTREHG